ncbi:MBL fold metallo-hydrolase [Gillisia sp. Hel_I_86]|uniref:MBL fold metallo-hydrolase n=1 Tax=Gillisia sp. Hel_I_86 TaxID=1249981 RepID=UPI00119E77D6|nr:MBL fold metallo-hydrolase [Gillisia sp. Hel_I_86]
MFVTHGDPDHYWYIDKVSAVSNAPVICNKSMVENVKDKTLMLGPRNKGLAFTTPLEKLYTISVGETIQLDGVLITGIKKTHGQLLLKLGPFSKTLKPGPKKRIGWGAIGFNIELDGKTVVNLGDILLQAREWQSIKNPDVLMIPIGGQTVHNTMGVQEALQTVK